MRGGFPECGSLVSDQLHHVVEGAMGTAVTIPDNIPLYLLLLLLYDDRACTGFTFWLVWGLFFGWLIRARKGEFGPKYYTPVEGVGLFLALDRLNLDFPLSTALFNLRENDYGWWTITSYLFRLT
jgi:hypothetical protein